MDPRSRMKILSCEGSSPKTSMTRTQKCGEKKAKSDTFHAKLQKWTGQNYWHLLKIEVLQTISKFCFPFCLDSLSATQVGHNFTFVLTDIDSKQRFGFCRLSSGAKSCFCILSYLPWFECFTNCCNILADYSSKRPRRLSLQDNQRSELLESLYRLPVPEAAAPVHLSVHSYFTVPDPRELPSIPENRNLTEYFVAVDVNNMLQLYASMLYERRILICCSKLSTLTACIHGSSAMLFPMYWQHVYIPVLPPHLLDYCCAPMPYLIGIHSSLMEKVKGMSLEDVVILNVDTNTLESPFDDLQNLPSDVVSTLKNRLRKMSTTTGDGVARAFLKAQASLFGSYRGALKIEPEEPITFDEEMFLSHRCSALRPFLQNAIQLQLFKQFIDGRLDLLNTGNGFSDVFEEEINMGEYAGSDKLYHQWLSTVKKGSGALINTMKTRANPAMKNVYKFAKDHAKMGIKEVKNRLKQKDLAENGCSVIPGDPLTSTAPSPSADRDPKSRDERRPITVHFGQEKVPPPRPPPPRIQRSSVPVRPPRPHVARRPKSNAVVESRRTSVSSPEQPQQYRTLKESDADGDEMISPDKQSDIEIGQEPQNTQLTHIDLLEDIFSNLEPDGQMQPLNQAKSLEDLRTPKEAHEDNFTFDYQRMDFTIPERSRMVPTLKHSHPYNKLWSMGHDDMAIPTRYHQTSPERDITYPDSNFNIPPKKILSASTEIYEPASSTQSSITIPRPHGRKTPELGIVLPPPAPRGTKQCAPVLSETNKPQHGEGSNLAFHISAGPFGAAPPEDSYMHTLDSSSSDMLQPVKVSAEIGVKEDILSLLDPLKTGRWQSDSHSNAGSAATTSEAPLCSNTPCFTPLQSEYVPATFPQQLGFSTTRLPFIHSPLNPFVQALPAELPVAVAPGRSFTPQAGTALAANSLLSTPDFYQSHRPLPSVLQGSSPFGVLPSGLPTNPVQQGPITSNTQQNFPPAIHGPAGHRTLYTTDATSKSQDGKSKAFPPIPPRPSKVSDPVLLPSRPGQPKDPFDDLISKTKQEVAPSSGKVEQLRKRWETFE
ncbi:LOW QUALITY PROTEIN: DENN domain-containing protein 1A [Bombina bombina]|uniref:LOW QUALITY PROTEIN: DENN domain-containing protein 1A n=1 Tax=Bombina bombina TaxID=8345 RepID=UPI00235A5D21|nr:LOW QUALITY PROTEIN: DENN domain-containing protein 1A [Bombina bombina]